MAHSLALGSSSIRELDGLYSLNDLHRASGQAQKHRPKYFLALEQTKELVGEIEKGGITPFQRVLGCKGGTFACRELVIAYAAWISAAFHLKVIRVFLASESKLDERPVNIPQPGSGLTEGRREFMDFVEKNVPQETYAELFNSKRLHKIADGYLAYALGSRSWIVSFDHRGNQVTTPVQEGECLLRYQDLPKLIAASDNFLEADLLAEIVKSCLERLLNGNQSMRETIHHMRKAQGLPSIKPSIKKEAV